METLIFVVILFLFAWLFLVLPSRRRQRSHKAMQDSVETGDEIITAGGIHGVVHEVGDEDVQLEIADGVVVKIDRRAVAAVARDVPADDDEEYDEEDEEDEEDEHDEEDEEDEAEPEEEQAEESLNG